jgi:hypothetical protein
MITTVVYHMPGQDHLRQVQGHHPAHRPHRHGCAQWKRYVGISILYAVGAVACTQTLL